jgi:hypothetical protein
MWSSICSTTLFWNVVHYNKKWARYDLTSSRKLRVIVKLYNSFSKVSHNRHVLQKNGNGSKMWSLSSSTTFVWNVFHYNKKWARYDQTSSRSLRVIIKVYNSFSTISHKRHVFTKKKLLKIKCVLLCSLQFQTQMFFIIIRNEQDMIKHPRVIKGYCQVVH